MKGCYAIDNRPLDLHEEALHKGFLKAALSGLVGEQWENDLEADIKYTSQKAFDYADAMLREYRRRITPVRADVTV